MSVAAGAPGTYEPVPKAAARIERYIQQGALANLLYNSFEVPVGQKYLAISTLLEQLRDAGVACLMSGSGSCCFALLEKNGPAAGEIERIVRDAWGETIFWVETSIS